MMTANLYVVHCILALDLLYLILLGDGDDEDPVLAEVALHLLPDSALGQGVALDEVPGHHHLAILASLLVPARHMQLLTTHIHTQLTGGVARGAQADL